MSFGHPLLLLLLLLVPLALVAYRLNERRRARYAVRYTNVAVLAAVAASGRPWRRWLTVALVLLAAALAATAVARPHVKTTLLSDNATVVLVLDVSGSMHAIDVKPTRLVAAQKALQLFMEKVPERLKLSLVLFAGDAQVATPPTRDHELLSQAIEDAGLYGGFGGTAIGDAIALAVQVGIQSTGVSGTQSALPQPTRQLASYVAAPPRKSSLVSILFLSDGKQNRGIIQPLEGAQRAKSAGFPVYTIALGTTGNTRLADGYGGGFGGFGGGGRLAPDPKTLRAIAQLTGGEFYRARDAKTLEKAYASLGSKLGQTPGNKEITDLFALGAAGLLILAGALSALWAPRIP
jgi:Ca-activated chloride channel family protein